jgi:hypothetical protein
MEIPVPILACGLASAFGVQGWILKEIVDLKVQVATLTANQNAMKKPSYKLPLAVMLAAFLPLFLIGCTGEAYAQVTNQAVGLPVQGTAVVNVANDVAPWVGVGMSVLWAFLTSKKKKKSDRTLEAVIKGVESCSTVLGGETGRRLKATISNSAGAHGVGRELHRRVKKATEK